MTLLKRLAFLAVALPFVAAPPQALATTAPADPCSLLSAADVSKALGQTYNSPDKTPAPQPFANTVQGTDCNYHAKSSGVVLWFRVYFDPSSSDAKDLFARLKMYYSPPTAVSGLGDEAYFDPAHAIHIRKGNVRFYLSFKNMSSIAPANQQQLQSLAGLVNGRL